MTARKRALLSVHDKSGLPQLAKGLVELGFELVASGGTAKALKAAGLNVLPVERVTAFPELLGGRVKTLHPAIHGGILARRTPEHLEELATHGVAPIDLVVCNLYPFVQTVAKPDVAEAEAIEEIDIGGVTLLRAAAKNFESVTVVCDPDEYEGVLAALRGGEVPLYERRRLALQAFRHTAAYDAAIATWLGGRVEPEETLPTALHLSATRVEVLRYGENPHQQGAIYAWTGTPSHFEQLQGKELSYNNIVDLEAAWAMPGEFEAPTVAIIKHSNPSGLASADNLVDAYRLALECDAISAFGSVIAVNQEVDADLIEAIGPLFMEVLVAPSFSPAALDHLAATKKSCRVVAMRSTARSSLVMKSVEGGLLLQTPDTRSVDRSEWTVVTEREPTEAEWSSLAFAWVACKHVKSNAIVFAQGTATVGVGAGQMNRVDSVALAARRAGDRSKGAVMASDAFFPFADGVETAGAAGVTACIQPGGSIRDKEVIAAANQLGISMVFTGVRHFWH